MLFGHEDKIAAFEKCIAQGTLGHAYLFFGDPQNGKELFARVLANYLERGVWEEPQGTLSDALFVLPEEGKSTLGIHEIRAVRHYLFQSPIYSSRRLAVLGGAERLTSEAQSAMLKIVEEPPKHGLIIFV